LGGFFIANPVHNTDISYMDCMYREELPEVDCYSFLSLMVSPPADSGHGSTTLIVRILIGYVQGGAARGGLLLLPFPDGEPAS
jgi:hypothetical protein